jgi:hypothetical protein
MPDMSHNVSIFVPSCLVNFTWQDLGANIGTYCYFPETPGTDAQTPVLPAETHSLCQCANTTEHRIVLLIGAATSVEEVNIESGVDTNQYTFINSTQLICTPTYTISRALVTINTTSQLPAKVDLLSQSRNGTLASVTDIDVANAFYATSSGVVDIDLAQNSFPDIDQVSFSGYLKDAVLHANLSSLLDLMSPETLATIANSYFQSLTAQIARNELLRQQSTPIRGTVWVMEDRLILRVISVRIIESFLILLLLFAVVIIFFLPKTGIMPLDPDCIGGLAVLISHSSELKDSLTGMGFSSRSCISNQLAGNRYQAMTTSAGTFKIQQMEDFPEILANQQKKSSQLSEIAWWRPYGATIYAQILAVLSAVSTIIVPELVLRDSQRNDGFANANSNGSTHYAVAYIPAVVMVFIRLLFSTLDESTKLFAPFSKLRLGMASSRDLSTSFLRYTSIEMVWPSLRMQNYAVLATTTAAFLGSFLNIAVSGVFIFSKVPSSQPINLSMETWFDSNFSLRADDTDTPVLASLVVLANLSSPALTYGELAFPNFEVMSKEDITTAGLSTVSAKLPAVRSKLNCTLSVGDRSIGNLTWEPEPWDNQTIGYIEISIPAIPGPPSPGGDSCSVQRDPISALHNASFGYASTAHGCPTWVWGNIGPSSIENIVLLYCFEHVGELLVDTTLTFPELTIDSTQPPVPDDKTGKVLYSQWSLPSLLGTDTVEITGPWSNETTFDDTPGFFGLLLGSSNEPALTDLSFFSDPALAPNMSNAIQHIHKTMRAQAFGRDGFTNQTDPFTNATEFAGRTIFPGTATNPNRERIMQSVPSTRVLQALLAFMGLCVLIKGAFIRTKEVLPKDPRSIAGLARLLVDSGVLELGKSWDGRERSEDLFEGHIYGMGWFEG